MRLIKVTWEGEKNKEEIGKWIRVVSEGNDETRIAGTSDGDIIFLLLLLVSK